MLQSLMSPLALNQSGLDPFSVSSVSSMSSPTTTLSPGNYEINVILTIIMIVYYLCFRYIWCGY